MPYIDIEKDAGPYVHALIKAPAPTQILAVSEFSTAKAWLEQWSQITGIKARVEEADASEFQGDDPTGLMRGMVETGHFIGEFGFTGGDVEILMPEQVRTMNVMQIRVDDADGLHSWRRKASPSVARS